MPDVYLYTGEANPHDVKLRDPTTLGAITADLSATEADDTLSGAAIVIVGASSDISEAADTLSGATAVIVGAAAAVTEAPDTLAGVAGVAVSLAAAVTEAADTLTGATAVLVQAAASLTEGNDSLGAAASVTVVASASISEAADSLSAATAVLVRANASITEAADSLSATVGTSVIASAAITEAADGLAAAAALLVQASAELTEANDVLSATASVAAITADLNVTEANDTLTAAAAVSGEASAPIPVTPSRGASNRFSRSPPRPAPPPPERRPADIVADASSGQGAQSVRAYFDIAATAKTRSGQSTGSNESAVGLTLAALFAEIRTTEQSVKGDGRLRVMSVVRTSQQEFEIGAFAEPALVARAETGGETPLEPSYDDDGQADAERFGDMLVEFDFA